MIGPSAKSQLLHQPRRPLRRQRDRMVRIPVRRQRRLPYRRRIPADRSPGTRSPENRSRSTSRSTPLCDIVTVCVPPAELPQRQSAPARPRPPGADPTVSGRAAVHHRTAIVAPEVCAPRPQKQRGASRSPHTCTSPTPLASPTTGSIRPSSSPAPPSTSAGTASPRHRLRSAGSPARPPDIPARVPAHRPVRHRHREFAPHENSPAADPPPTSTASCARLDQSVSSRRPFTSAAGREIQVHPPPRRRRSSAEHTCQPATSFRPRSRHSSVHADAIPVRPRLQPS